MFSLGKLLWVDQVTHLLYCSAVMWLLTGA